MFLKNYTSRIQELDSSMGAKVQNILDQKTKPIGSLGYVESLVRQICIIQDSLQPELKKPTFLLFAADHGLAKNGVSPYPQEVTGQMLQNFIRGGAAINVLCRQHQIDLKVIDCGTIKAINHTEIIDRRLGSGTKNALYEPAMTEEQCRQGFINGYSLLESLAKQGCNIVGLGEMGIGNSSAAALISAKLLDLPISELVCAGAGCNATTLAHKQRLLEQLIEKYSSIKTPWEVMKSFGGFELATALGAMFAAAEKRVIILIDGFIMSSVALTAYQLEPKLRDYMVFSHQSASKGHRFILEHLQVRPLLQLDMRLGEGSGAAMAFPLLQSAIALLREMASFDEAEVSRSIKG